MESGSNNRLIIYKNGEAVLFENTCSERILGATQHVVSETKRDGLLLNRKQRRALRRKQGRK